MRLTLATPERMPAPAAFPLAPKPVSPDNYPMDPIELPRPFSVFSAELAQLEEDWLMLQDEIDTIDSMDEA